MLQMYWIKMTKNKIMFWVPVIELVVILPMLIYIMSRNEHRGELELANEIIRQLHVWIPLGAGWWSIVFANDFFSSDGNELLYLFHKTLHIVMGQGVSFFLYVICIIMAFPLYRMIFSMDWIVMWQVIMESLMIAGFTFFLSFFLQNTGAALLIIITYCIYLNLFDKLHMFDIISVFPTDCVFPAWESGLVIKTFVIAAVFWGLGGICVKKRRVLL